MVEYSKKTNAELVEILKSRSLPYSGKKADLVARLLEADKAAESNEEAKAPPAPSTAAPPAQEPASKAAPTKPTPAPKPTPETSKPEPAVEAPADSPSANTDTALATSASYALNLPASHLDDEMAKRKARAERFGTTPTAAATTDANGDGSSKANDDETQKALERAKRFGTGQNAMGKLDQPLSVERERGRKRGRGAEEDVEGDGGGAEEDPGLLRRGRGRGGFRGRRRGGVVGGPQGGVKRRGEGPTGVQKAAFSSDKDRQAADARKKRFAGA